MAGAGYKLFNTGDVLTAAQVNTYLNEQTVMVFASSAARTSALSGVLAEGMVSYLQDTNAVEVYNGSAWVNLAADQTPLTTKGDLFTFSTVDARLAVGNNGETLVADSAATTGLRYQGSQAAAKNAVINGGMDIWQRGTSSASQGYVTADRWYMTGASTTFSQETSDLPTGFRFALKCTMSGTASPQPILTIETQDSIRFAGQTVVLSYYVKTSNSTNAVIRLDTSNNVDESVTGTYSTIATNSVATTTSWTRISATFAVPSASRTLRVVVGSNGNLTSGQTILISGVQLELGSVATQFSRAGGTLAGELAACQRYFAFVTTDSRFPSVVASAVVVVGTALPVTMRTTPTLAFSGAATQANVTSASLSVEGAGNHQVVRNTITTTSGSNTDTYYVRGVTASAEL